MSRFLLRIFAVLLVLMASCDKLAPAQFSAIDITGIQGYGSDLQLTDHNGQRRSLVDFRGKVVALFFGFTHCPDVCPTTLSDLREVMGKLGGEASRVQVLFVTVDPKRDTQELLAKYVPAFHPSFLGLRGDAAATERVTRDFKIFTREQPGKTPESYSVDHTAGMLVFDPKGRLRLFVNYGLAPELMAKDFKLLLRESA